MSVKLYQPTDAEWTEILAVLPPPERSTRTEARQVFQTMLHVLWFDAPIRDMKQPNFASASVTSTLLWNWAERGRLGHAWAAYLRTNSALQIRHWQAMFDYYEASWKHRRVAPKHAGRVHSLWYRQLSTGLARELRRRKRVRSANP